MTRHPIVKSRKQHIRLWFEYYRLCLDEPDLQSNLNDTYPFYEEWGDCRDVKFDDWWKDHSHLFGGTRVEVIQRVQNHTNVLNLSVPLNLPVTQTVNEIKRLIVETQESRLKELGIDPKTVKSTSVGFGKYELSPGEIRGRTVNEDLVIYRLWRDQGKPKVGHSFCQSIIDHMENRPRSKWKPHYLQGRLDVDRNGNPVVSPDQKTQVRRSLDRSRKILVSVSKGRFP